jgi:hypothetical protein
MLALAAVVYVAGRSDRTSPATTSTSLDCRGDHCNLTIPLEVSLAIRINVTDHGKLLSSTYLPHDLITDNFYKWLIAFLNNAQSGQTVYTSLKVVGGTTWNVGMWGVLSSYGCGTISQNYIGCTAPGLGGLIEVGSGVAAAARTDVSVTTVFQSYFQTSTSCSTGSTDSIVITGSENANTGVTMTEAGLFYSWYSTLAGANLYVMFAHDVFSGVAVSAGNTITVQYTWNLNNAGYNYNLCTYLAGLLAQPNGPNGNVRTPDAYIQFKDSTNHVVSWVPTCNAGVVTGGLGALNPTHPESTACVGNQGTINAMQIEIGTGSTAFTPASYALNTYYAQNYVTSVNYDLAGNAYETANILLATGATIREAGIFLTINSGCISPNFGTDSCGSYGSDTIMLLAFTFSAQVVPSGKSIGITFVESG